MDEKKISMEDYVIDKLSRENANLKTEIAKLEFSLIAYKQKLDDKNANGGDLNDKANK